MIGSEYFRSGDLAVLEGLVAEAASWPECPDDLLVQGGSLVLTLKGQELPVTVPAPRGPTFPDLLPPASASGSWRELHQRYRQRIPSARHVMPTATEDGLTENRGGEAGPLTPVSDPCRLLSSGLDVWAALEPLGPQLWALWEVLVTGQPVRGHGARVPRGFLAWMTWPRSAACAGHADWWRPWGGITVRGGPWSPHPAARVLGGYQVGAAATAGPCFPLSGSHRDAQVPLERSCGVKAHVSSACRSPIVMIQDAEDVACLTGLFGSSNAARESASPLRSAHDP